MKITSNDPLKAYLNDKNVFLQNLQQMAFEFIELSKQAMDNLTDEEHLALKVLSQDKIVSSSKKKKKISL